MLRAQRPDGDGMNAARTPRGRMAGGIVGAGAFALALPLLAACGGSQDTPAGPGVSPPAASTGGGGGADVVMLMRHAEKPVLGGAAQGVASNGTASATSLTVTGWVRAGALVALFAPARGVPPAGLSKPTALWASDPRGEHGQRPQQTVTPLAGRLGVAVDIRFGKGQGAALAGALAAAHGVTLVSWQHEEIPAIAAHLGVVSPPPPSSWPDDRYDVIWVLTRSGAGWAFGQVPQMLLAGDRPDAIAP